MERRLSQFFTEEIAQKVRLIEKVFKGKDKTLREDTLGAGEISLLERTDDPVITGLEYDSRKVKPGNIFFALSGLHTDGHTYIPDAINRGAAVIVHQNEVASFEKKICYLKVQNSRFAMSAIADAFYQFPSQHLAIIGVTGTEGKSTTVYLIYQLLALLGKKAGFISTVQYGDGESVYWNDKHETTPEAVVIHKLLADMRRHGVEYAVIEASSHGLSPRTNRLGDVAFDVGVMTNVNHEHLEFHGSWDQYRNDKANLFRALDDNLLGHVKLPPFSSAAGKVHEPQPLPCFGVVNGDDPSAVYFAQATKHKTYTFSTRGGNADISLRSVYSHADGNWYEVFIRESALVMDIRDQLPGMFNAGNVLASLLTVSQLLSIPVESILLLTPYFKPVRGRMTPVKKGQPFEIIVDYAHTPHSFEMLFPVLRERMDKQRGGRIIALFGSAGERDTEKRKEQGKIASQWSDIIILTDEDPRGEVPLNILKEIASGVENHREGENLFLVPDRPAAVRVALVHAQKGDLILLLGKGHENSIIYSDRVMPYDEIGEAEKALAELGYK
ncbi:MAG: UDP-N-acetylmuramoyl-L-alanyl-D-glutamate--2,6-diaminopimelate ligase [Treponema sp.]|nr:UDP-N-acetylmuramoyl-L-alanyl-D-glutamate--2,6-diaminopimelate ligase [Treponema sp.]